MGTLVHITLSLSILFFIIPTVLGHGNCVVPRFRGTLNTHSLGIKSLEIPGLDYDNCPHCLNGGGKGAVMTAANGIWRLYDPLNADLPPRHDAGHCGDPITDAPPRAHENGGRFGPPKNYPIVASYSEGQIIEITADITTNHNGFFQFFICNAAKCGGDISDACFQNGHCQELYRVKTPECESQNSVECGPVDPHYPGRFYVPCRKGDHVGEHFIGGKYMQYKLPDGFSTSHAVIQWYWATANSCNPPGYLEYFNQFPMPGWGSCPGDGGALGMRNPTLAECGESKFPEEFWTCADVSVGSSEKTQIIPQNGIPTITPTPKIPTQSAANTVIIPPTVQPSPTTQIDRSSVDANKAKKDRRRTDKSDQSNRGKRRKNLQNQCIQQWQQCGGIYHEGSKTCCDRNYKCRVVNKYYSQCMSE